MAEEVHHYGQRHKANRVRNIEDEGAEGPLRRIHQLNGNDIRTGENRGDSQTDDCAEEEPALEIPTEGTEESTNDLHEQIRKVRGLATPVVLQVSEYVVSNEAPGSENDQRERAVKVLVANQIKLKGRRIPVRLMERR